ncbi:MAG: hypothetical protein A3H96_24200 [Acidobacteria bacterium RIFCSPLOWO2_02_FULL_67_36]|nr:MAG: hypothetical protein A3H96_24200 [Acidobacteria bacterium RIFCSPLOWO2_02_FULL_67_36]OFW19153.1 MAG: hypothetical protein A3G21_04450 [Acidobacteria bacterium RIFCSPLOWO2_12_FULL_66_21]
MLTATITRIDRSAVHDGPGVRTVVFFKGCPLRCEWCHSPETQAASPAIALYHERCIGCGSCMAACTNAAVTFVDGRHGVLRSRCRVCGECGDACPSGAREVIGRVVSVDDVMDAIERDVVFYDQSGGGVTASGGEPLLQAPFVEALLKHCRERGIATAVETCGLAPSGALLSVAPWTDLFLFDLKLMDAVRHRRVTGRSNRQILYNLRLLASRHRNVRIRFPLIPGVNDDPENLAATGAFLSSLGVTQLDVLPYHRGGVAKYERLDRQYALLDLAAPSAEEVDGTIAALTRHGLDVRIGGLR